MESTNETTPELAVVIVSYNVRDLLRRCLSSLGASLADPRIEIHVVDNASMDSSAAMVAAEFPHVRLHTPGDNRGYAWANNLALRELRSRIGKWPRYVLLLNPDTELPAGSVESMISLMDDRPSVAVAGPRLVKTNGELDLACRRSFPSPGVSLFRMSGLSRAFPRSRLFGRYNLTYLDQLGVYEVDSVVGAFMLVRGSVLEDVGLLDEAFFMYGEDLDWAFRIKQRGWQVVYNGQVTVIHHKGMSSRQRSLRSNRAFYQAMIVFFNKHYSATTSLPLRLLVLSGIYGAGALAICRTLATDLIGRIRSHRGRSVADGARS